MSISPARFRDLALSFPGAVEGSHMGHPDFRVGGRIFASLTHHEAGGAMKCDPVNVIELVRRDPQTYRDAWNGRWLGVRLEQAAEEDIRDLLEDAWIRTAPKRAVMDYRMASRSPEP